MTSCCSGASSQIFSITLYSGSMGSQLYAFHPRFIATHLPNCRLADVSLDLNLILLKKKRKPFEHFLSVLFFSFQSPHRLLEQTHPDRSTLYSRPPLGPLLRWRSPAALPPGEGSILAERFGGESFWTKNRIRREQIWMDSTSLPWD